MGKQSVVLLLCVFTLISGCAVAQSRQATALQDPEADRPKTYRRFARPRPFIGFPYFGGVVGGIGGVGVGGVCP